MKSGIRWSKKEISPILKEETKGKLKAYYGWRLETKTESYAHVFLCELESQKDLEKYWRTITNQIAVYVQSEIDSLLERSNFYVWFFVKEEVLKSLQKSIEDDAYSSKKFVVPGKPQLSLEEKLDLIRKRLFEFDFSLQKSEKQMIAKVEMENFRTYRGKKIFDFSTEEGIARLVVLFAPNGMGKTSFFDGVEWNLTSGIDRFKELGKKKSYSGEVVLKNKEADFSESASVNLYFDDGECIGRNVSKINNQTKKDTGKGSVSIYPGEKLKKYLGQEESWKNLILQHHKIDGFIAAKTSQELYKEWGSLWDVNGKKREEFEKSYKKRKQAEKEFNNVATEYEELKEECEKLENGRIFAEKLSKDVEEFQRLSGKDTLGGFDFKKVSEEEYVKWSNLVDYEMSLYQQEQIMNEEKIQYVRHELETDVEHYQSILQLQRKQEEQEKLIQGNLINCHNKKVLLLQEKELEEQKRSLEMLKEPYGIVKEQGEVWYKQGKKYFEISEKQEEIKAGLKDIEENTIPDLEDEVESLELQYIQKQKVRIEELTYKSLCQHITEIENLQKDAEELTDKIQSCIKNKSQNELMLNDMSVNLQKLKEKKIESLTQVLLLYQFGKLGIEENEKELEDKRKQILNSLNMHQNQQVKLAKIDQSISLEEKLEGEIHEILLNARRIIEKQKLSSCPICNTTFKNQQELLENTYRTSSIKGDLLKKERIEQECRLKELENQIAQSIEDYNAELERRIQNEEIECNNLRRIFTNILEQQENLQRQIDEKEERIKQIQKEDQQRGIYVVYSREGIESWYDLWKAKQDSEISHLKQQLEQNKSQLQVYQNMKKVFLDTLKEGKDTQLKIQQEMHDTFVSLKKVESLIKAQTYEEIVKKHLSMEKEQKDLKEKREVLRDELEKYQDIILIGEEAYREELSDLQANMQITKDEADKVQFRIQKVFQEEKKEKNYVLQDEEIKRKEKELCADAERIHEIVKTLNPLRYNNEVRNYFSNWRNCHEKLKEKSLEKDAKEIAKLEAENMYQKAKLDIQKKMQEFLYEFQVNDIYEKLEPHEELKSLVSEFDFSDDGKPELAFHVADENGKTYPPEWYFSTAQLNAVAFSIFLGRALQAKDTPIKSILIDDPIGHFDDMNIVGFVDLLRNIVENTDRQLIISTHEERVFGLIQRKIPKEDYPVKYIDFREV